MKRKFTEENSKLKQAGFDVIGHKTPGVTNRNNCCYNKRSMLTVLTSPTASSWTRLVGVVVAVVIVGDVGDDVEAIFVSSPTTTRLFKLLYIWLLLLPLLA
jgi:hypothetical protein